MTHAPQNNASRWLPLLREALTQQGYFRLPLRGDSMVPTLPIACDIEVIPLAGSPRLGDLIVFAVDDVLLAHRLVGRSGDVLTAQGDNRLGADRPLHASQVLGRVRIAWVDGTVVWPRPLAGGAAWFWISRSHLLRGARWAVRWMRRPTSA